MNNHAFDIFLCYTRKDNTVADLLSNEFQRSSAHVFDAVINSGEDYADLIVTAIRHSKAMVVLCSADSENSRWVHNEIAYAINLNIPIIPILLGDYQLSGRLELLLDKKQSLRYAYDETSLIHITNSVISQLQNIYPQEIQNIDLDCESEPIYQPKEIKNVYSEYPERSGKKGKILGCGCLTIIILTIVALLYIVATPRNGNHPAPESSTISESKHISTEEEAARLEAEQLAKDTMPAASLPFQGHPIPPADHSCWTNTPLIIISISLVVVIISAVCIILYFKKRRFCVRFYNRKSNSTVDVYINGIKQETIQSGTIKDIKNKKGEYAIRIQSIENEDIFIEFLQKFSKENHNKLIEVELPSNTPISTPDIKKYFCFIGGSIAIINERNAARAVLSILYNKYSKYNFHVTAYTCDDFTQKHKEGGHQLEYNEFIRQQADCTIFIICKHIGDKTKEEYETAVKVCEQTKYNRPTIFVYNDVSCEEDESVKKFRETVDSKHVYWRDYHDIENLMLRIESDLSSELMDLLMMHQ